MRDIDKLNAANNPINYGDKVMIEGLVMKVGQNIDGHWFLYHQDRPQMCTAGSMVDFIARIVDTNNQSIKQR